MNAFIIRYEPCMIYISVSFPRNFHLFYFANIRLIFIFTKWLFSTKHRFKCLKISNTLFFSRFTFMCWFIFCKDFISKIFSCFWLCFFFNWNENYSKKVGKKFCNLEKVAYTLSAKNLYFNKLIYGNKCKRFCVWKYYYGGNKRSNGASTCALDF